MEIVISYFIKFFIDNRIFQDYLIIQDVVNRSEYYLFYLHVKQFSFIKKQLLP